MAQAYRNEADMPSRAARDEIRSMRLSGITDAQVDGLHMATLEILDRVGVQFMDEECVEIMRKGGARVDPDDPRRVRVPAYMVERALASAPCRIPVGDRIGGRAMFLEQGRSYYGTGSDTPNTIDIATGERRLATTRDTANFATIADAIDNIDFVMSMGLASDAPVDGSYVHQFEAMTLNTVKPIMFTAGDLEDAKTIVAMAESVAGGARALRDNPFVMLYDEPSSPLRHSSDALKKLLFMADKGLPCLYAPAVLMGGSGPVTAAGTVVVGNAEILSALVLSQLRSPGAPVIYAGSGAALDMRTMICVYGSVEEALTCAAMTRLAERYRLPVFVTAGCSNAVRFDQQAAAEGVFSIFANALAGATMIHDLGYLEAGMTSSAEMLLLCDEAIGLIKTFGRGIEVSADTLALEVIERVGPGGNYMDDDHTFEHYKKHLHFSDLLDRSIYSSWTASGEKTFADRAREKALAILASHRAPAVPQAAADAMRALRERHRQL